MRLVAVRKGPSALETESILTNPTPPAPQPWQPYPWPSPQPTQQPPYPPPMYARPAQPAPIPRWRRLYAHWALLLIFGVAALVEATTLLLWSASLPTRLYNLGCAVGAQSSCDAVSFQQTLNTFGIIGLLVGGAALVWMFVELGRIGARPPAPPPYPPPSYPPPFVSP
jgi:hypothetical protein